MVLPVLVMLALVLALFGVTAAIVGLTLAISGRSRRGGVLVAAGGLLACLPTIALAFHFYRGGWRPADAYFLPAPTLMPTAPPGAPGPDR